MYEHYLIEQARMYRSEGMSYSEICAKLGMKIPKGTMAYWYRDVVMPPEYHEKVAHDCRKRLEKARKVSVVMAKKRREEKIAELQHNNVPSIRALQDSSIAKLMLATLYWGEGGKNMRGSISFSNSDPGMIKTYIALLKKCYPVHKKRFRVTVQCRADQDNVRLENYWSQITGISLEQFYSTRPDPRTVGKPTKRLDYKGVCRIDYFSADIYKEVCVLIDLCKTWALSSSG